MGSCVGSVGENGVLLRMRGSQFVCLTAVVAASYSASHVDNATTFFLVDVQPIEDELTVCSMPG